MGRRYLVFASTFLAVVPIFVQNITIVTRTHVRSDCVGAFVHAAAIVHSTLVDIYLECKLER